MNRPHATSVAQAVLVLLATGTPVILAVVLHALPPAGLETAGLGWVVPVLAGALGVAAALATLASVVVGLRDGSLGALFLAGASAALVGGSLGLVAGASGISLAVTSSAALTLAAIAADRLETMVHGRATRFAAAAAAVLVAGTLAAVEIAPATARAIEPLAPSLLLAAAALAAIGVAAAARLRLAVVAVLTAVGAISLWLARGQDADLALGLVALLGATLLTARSMLDRASAMTEAPLDTWALPDVADHVADGVLRFDGRLQLRSWNRAAAKMLVLDDASGGSRLDDLLGVPLSQLPTSSDPRHVATTVGGLEVALHRDADGLTVVLRDPRASRDVDRLGRELRSTIEELLQARRTVDLQRAELVRAATTDPLTGVASRGAIIARLDLEVAEARRYQHPVAIVLLDVDGFGELNAEFGLAVGDAILREVALRVRLRIRAADSLGRSGSDGFLAILPHTDEAGAAAFGDALRRRVAQRPMRIGDAVAAVTISAGVAVMQPGEELDRDGLLARAEEALASARRAGGARMAIDASHGLPTSLDRHRPARPESGEAPSDEDDASSA
jgi:diguanylate cyclase (GGDEF)-like protein